MTHPQFIVMASTGYLQQTNKEVNQVDISKQSDIDVMTVSTIIRNLEKAQLLIRQSFSIDSRAKVIELTKAGEQLLSKALPLVEKVDTNFFEVLQSVQATFNSLLLQLVAENLKDKTKS
nr:MarR family winged helix-turn-helix transcriptional regulator [Listeria immobilis]